MQRICAIMFTYSQSRLYKTKEIKQMSKQFTLDNTSGFSQETLDIMSAEYEKKLTDWIEQHGDDEVDSTLKSYLSSQVFEDHFYDACE